MERVLLTSPFFGGGGNRFFIKKGAFDQGILPTIFFKGTKGGKVLTLCFLQDHVCTVTLLYSPTHLPTLPNTRLYYFLLILVLIKRGRFHPYWAAFKIAYFFGFFGSG